MVTETARDIRDMMVSLPDGQALVGWKDIAQAMRYSVAHARRIAETDPTFPLRRMGGQSARVYVRYAEFAAWWNHRTDPAIES